MSPPHLGPKLLMGGAWITTYNTLVGDGYYQNVPVNYTSYWWVNTQYSAPRSAGPLSRTTSRDTWTGSDSRETSYTTTWTSNWTSYWQVSTQYSGPASYNSQVWVDTSYYRSTSRETSW